MIPSWSNRWQTFDFGEVYSVINCVRYLCRIDCYTLLHWKAITNPAKEVYYPRLTWLGFEDMIYCRRGEYANHYTTYEVSLMRQLIPNNPEHKVSFRFFLWSSLLAKLVSFCFAFSIRLQYCFCIRFVLLTWTFLRTGELCVRRSSNFCDDFSCEHVIENWRQMNFISFMLLINWIQMYWI